MQELDFSLDGVDASEMGIQLQRPLSFSEAVPRVQTIQLAGRSGDLHIDEGAYNNRIGTANCFALTQFDVMDKMNGIMEFLFGTRGYRKLRTSEDSGHYWYARVSNAGEIAPRLRMLNPFNITFDCKPYRMVEGSEDFRTNQPFWNPTGFTTYPLLYVTSASAGGIIESAVGHIVFAESAYDTYIDCEDCTAYNRNGTSMDYTLKSDVFVEFRAGSNDIATQGVTLEVAPRWRRL